MFINGHTMRTIVLLANLLHLLGEEPASYVLLFMSSMFYLLLNSLLLNIYIYLCQMPGHVYPSQAAANASTVLGVHGVQRQ